MFEIIPFVFCKVNGNKVKVTMVMNEIQLINFITTNKKDCPITKQSTED